MDFYVGSLARLQRILGVQDVGITAIEFLQKTNELLEDLRQDGQIGNLANAVCLPVLLLPFPKDDFDYGQQLEKLLAALASAYGEVFPGYSFINHRAGTLAEQVSIVDQSHQRLINRLLAGETIPALHFPNPLQGFSVLADRE